MGSWSTWQYLYRVVLQEPSPQPAAAAQGQGQPWPPQTAAASSWGNAVPAQVGPSGVEIS